MCGIAGYIDPKGSPNVTQDIGDMLNSLSHRGPDDYGVWTDGFSGVALGHRRLAILDISPQGHQPMQSACGRYLIIFNGEIYNHSELKVALELAGAAPIWRGHSDTEVMLAAIAFWGIEKSLGKFVGMFAFALWDRLERVLSIARDRLGEKPLYYGWSDGAFLFGSELKALRAHPKFSGEIDRDALALYLRHNYIPAPYSIYKNTYKLPPGTWLQVKSGKFPGDPIEYWSAKSVVESGLTDGFAGTESEALDELERLLKQSVAGQMVADVPLGAFLSGGIDSSTVVALMQAQSTHPVKTFTIGFQEEGYNEAESAHAVAKYLGTEHTELYVSPQQAMAVIPQLPHIYDEPFSDSSQIPTWLVCKLAREQVKVSLSGDGGDEFFGGYNRYFMGSSIWRKIKHFPLPIRRLAARMLTEVSPDHWDVILNPLFAMMPSDMRFNNPGDKLHKLASVVRSQDAEQLYLGLISHWNDPSAIVLGSKEPLGRVRGHKFRRKDFVEDMMLVDTVTYLPDDILVKVDRAAMSVSLETRVPLLDHRILEFAWRLPLDMKIRHGQGKHLLRQVLYKYVPKALVERPKMGFGVPLDSWLRGPLKTWAEELLDEHRLKREGFFDPVTIRNKWAEHLSGKRNWSYHLWDVLMFQSWLEYTHG